MSDTPWDSKLKAFLKKTGDDFKRAGADVRQEAERLLSEAKDPVRAKKIKEGLNDVGSWAKKAAEELAGYVETGVKKAEVVLKEVVAKPAAAPAPKASAPKPSAPRAEKAAPAPVASAPRAAPVKKTVGGGAKKAAGAKKGGAKKPLGRAKKA